MQLSLIHSALQCLDSMKSLKEYIYKGPNLQPLSPEFQSLGLSSPHLNMSENTQQLLPVAVSR